MKTYVIPMPAFWASYLINGDNSGITPGEQMDADAYVDKQGIASVLSCEEEEEYFSWSFDLHGGSCPGGNLLDYTVTLRESSDAL